MIHQIFRSHATGHTTSLHPLNLLWWVFWYYSW